MATSPGRLNSTRPVGPTSPMSGSLLLKLVNRVTSRRLPSANVATTASCCDLAGEVRTRGPGVTSSETTGDRVGSSSFVPVVSQARIISVG